MDTYLDERKPVNLPSKKYIFSLVLGVGVVPVCAFLFGGFDSVSAFIGGLFGLAIFLLLLHHPPGRSSPFPIKTGVTVMLVQGLVYLALAHMAGVATSASLGEPQSYPFVMVTPNARPVATMSVILPCANEAMFAVKTARSIGELTPKSVLEEIVIVDDGSTPPLEQFFKENGRDVLEKYPIRFIRHEKFTGLINAKQQGGNAAKGDVLTFLDCHVLPRDYGEGVFWTDPIMERIGGNYKRVVVPSITDLDVDKWEEIGRPKGIAKCYLSFDVDFKWFDSEDDFIPIMSGGLLSMSKDWWWETKGYDVNMAGWGGENIDQSLRIWLCGGEIVQARDSHVAHMWRVKDKPNTASKYTVPAGSMYTNRYRAAKAWMDEYVEKVEEYSFFSSFANTPVDVTAMTAVKDELKCKPFQWFINRFSKLYLDAAVMPGEIFRIRDPHTDWCLARRDSGKKERHDIVAVPCSVGDGMQLWHFANRDGETCCSGIRNYDSMYCMAGHYSGELAGYECSTFGKADQQQVNLTADGQIFFNRYNTCAVVAAHTVVTQVPCEGGSSVTAQLSFTPVKGDEEGLFHIVEANSGECLTAFARIGFENEAGNFEFNPCNELSVQQRFNITEVGGGAVVIQNFENLCIDAADGTRLLAFPCYDASAPNHKQKFILNNGTLLRNTFHPTCLSAPESLRFLQQELHPISLVSCLDKAEQKFEQIPISDGAQLLRSGQWCMHGEGNAVQMRKCPELEIVPDEFLWFAESPNRFRSKGANKCLDGNDAKDPILYPCTPEENINQEWLDPNAASLLKHRRSGLCLDFRPAPERRIAITKKCASSAKWTIHDPHESTEIRIYRETAQKEVAPIHG